MIGQRLTLLLCCATLCWAQDNWEWPCGNVTVQEGVNISQVFDRWYLVAANLPLLNRDDICIEAELSSINSSSLFFQIFLSHSSGARTERNFTVEVLTPAKWINDEIPTAVIDLSPEGNTFVVAECKVETNGENTTMAENVIVLSKSKNPDLPPVFDRLRWAGITVVNNIITANMSTCIANSVN